MKTRSRIVMLLVLALLVAAGSPSFGQSASASLSGVIKDPSGAVVVGAAVRLTNVDTNVTQATQTNEAGLYAFASIPPGTYNLSAKHTGFKETVRADLVLHVGDTVSQNFALEIGTATESVTVSGAAVAVNTEDATVGTVVERQVVENMPLNGRSFQGLITLTPGVATITANTTATAQFVVNGGAIATRL